MEFIVTLATVAQDKVDSAILKSPYISVLCDESTDISISKKLVVYCRVINPEMSNLKNIKASKIMGLGTDGAKVKTGTGIGLTGFMQRIMLCYLIITALHTG